jgi:ribose transport system substrate-binding protein
MQRRRGVGPRALAFCALFLVVVAGVVVTGCGGGGSSSGGGGSSGGSTEASGSGEGASIDTAAIEAKLKPFLNPPAKIPLLTEPLKERPTGKTIEYLECSATPCKIIGEGLKKAAAVMGMSFKSIQAGATPESFQAAAQQAVEDKPNVVMMSAIDSSIIKKQLEEMQSEGIVVAAWATTTPPKGLVNVFLLQPTPWYNAGAALARYAILHSNGEANVLYINQSVFTFAPVFGEGFQKTIEAECPGCSFKETDTLPEEDGTQIPTKVVSELQADPSINWVLFAYGAMNVGVPQAIQAAELSEQAQLMSQEDQSNNYEYLKAGEETVNNSLDLELQPAFYAIDGVARVLDGQKLPDYSKLNTHWLIEKDDITFDPKTEHYVPIEGFQEQFEELWGVK